MYLLLFGLSQTQVTNNLTPILTALIGAVVTYNLYCMNRQDKAIERVETKIDKIENKVDSLQKDVSEIKGFLMGFDKTKPEASQNTEKEVQKTS